MNASRKFTVAISTAKDGLLAEGLIPFARERLLSVSVTFAIPAARGEQKKAMTDVSPLSAQLSSIIETCFQSFTSELNTFHTQPATDMNVINHFASRVDGYVWILFGYDNVMRTLKLGDQAALDRLAKIRNYVEQTQTAVRNLQTQQLIDSIPKTSPVFPPSNNPSSDPSAILLQQQRMHYQNKVFMHVNFDNMSLIDAQILARSETGYSGE